VTVFPLQKSAPVQMYRTLAEVHDPASCAVGHTTKGITMTNYQDITRQIGDQWVAALKDTEERVAQAAGSLADARAKVDVPVFPSSEVLAKLNESLAEGLPKPSEIVEANFDLTNRLLTAQRDLTLRLLEVASTTAAEEADQRADSKAT